MTPLRRRLATVSLLAIACAAPQDRGRDRDVNRELTAETQRMADRLRLLARNTPALADPFRNDRRLEALRRQSAPDDAQSPSFRSLLELANEELRAGNSQAAIEQFESLLRRLERERNEHPEGLERRIQRELALAYLRLGEQLNCLENHHATSCLLPLPPEARHRNAEPSTHAVRLLTELLEEDSTDPTNLWLYNVAASTIGAYPDGIREDWLIPLPGPLGAAEAEPFRDVAGDVGLATVSLAGGVALEDFNSDGRLDVVVSSWGVEDPLRLFVARLDGEGQLSYEERTKAAGLSQITGGLNLITADYDNDGDTDILLLRGGWRRGIGRLPNSLLRNDGSGRFVDVTESSGVLSLHPTQTATFADFDNDGWLDLLVGNEFSADAPSSSELYLNGGSAGAVFRETGRAAGLAPRDRVKGVAAGDFDNDGRIDVAVSTMSGPNRLYRNTRGANGDLRFVDVSADAGVRGPISSFATWFFDHDNDGDLDLLFCGYDSDFRTARSGNVIASFLGRPSREGRLYLYRNDGNGSFSEVALAAGIGEAYLPMGANFGDFDNDGWLDFYLGTGAPDYAALVPNRAFRNLNGERFVEITAAAGLGHLQKGHGVAFADMDQDGDLDLFNVLGGAFSGDVYANALFQNPGSSDRSITLRLEGTSPTTNRSALGARITVSGLDAAGRRQSIHRVNDTGASFGSSTLRQTIGLGSLVAPLQVTVRWPGGGEPAEETFGDLTPGHAYHLKQGEKARSLELPPLRFASLGAAGEHQAGHSAHPTDERP